MPRRFVLPDVAPTHLRCQQVIVSINLQASGKDGLVAIVLAGQVLLFRLRKEAALDLHSPFSTSHIKPIRQPDRPLASPFLTFLPFASFELWPQKWGRFFLLPGRFEFLERGKASTQPDGGEGGERRAGARARVKPHSPHGCCPVRSLRTGPLLRPKLPSPGRAEENPGAP